MNQKSKNSGLKCAILTMSFIQMATNAVASILANIAEEFPGVSVSAIQYLMTFPNLLVVVVSVFVAKLSSKFAKRTLAATGLGFACLSGILSFFFHQNLTVLYVWAGMLGIGIGLTIPIATSLISDYFSGNEKNVLLGYQTSAANIGSMLMTFFGGLLAAWGWHYDYLVYLLALPGVVFTLLFVPRRNVEMQGISAKNQKKKIPKSAWLYFMIAAVFMLLFYVGPTNLAMYASERGIGGISVAGTAATILLIGGSVMGIFFGKVADRIGTYTIPVGFLMMALGYGCIYMSHGVVLLYLGSFLVGTSNTLVLPQCMGQMVSDDKQQSTFLMSVVLAVANLGTFLTPVLTKLAEWVMGNQLARSRILFAGIISVILMVIFRIVFSKQKGNKEN